jgi:ABC-2 type transport system permease protein
LLSPEALARGPAPFMPLFAKELRDLFAGRSLWVLLLLQSPLVGYSFIQAVSLYSEASRPATQFPEVAHGLSPFDGIVVPTFGALYLATTLLFPFIAIRTIGAEKQNGGLKLLLQLPYNIPELISAKLVALLVAWVLALIPCLSALAIWPALGGHLGAGETLNLLLGHLLYMLVISGIALFAAAVTDGSATAAIMTLAATIGFWVLDFAAAGQDGFIRTIAALSLTAVLHSFEHGIFSLAIVAGAVAAAVGLLALAGLWLPSGVATGRKLVLSGVVVVIAAFSMLGAAQLRVYGDMTEDGRNSFPSPDANALASLGEPLTVVINLAAEDPRFMDFDRTLLGKLRRTVPKVRVIVAAGRSSLFNTGDDAYGLITYQYGGRETGSRSTSPEEVLPLIYGLAGIDPPARGAEATYPGYPLVADATKAGGWFYMALPLLVLIAWAFQSGLLGRAREVWARK